MRRIIAMTGVALLGALVAGGALAGNDQDANMVIMKMIDAHGGMEKWEAVPTVSYEHTLIAPQELDDPWTSQEVTDPRSRREYQVWPLENARIVYDGEQVWSVNWKRLNPPTFMVNNAFYFLNMPWITQDPGVKLEMVEAGKLPEEDGEFIKVRMTFEPDVGASPDDYYIIYIDPETYRMKATEFVVTYGAMLDLFKVPADRKYVGPICHVYEDYATVDGLTIPSQYRTYGPFGNVMGNHTVENISFSKKFDESQLKRPDDAVTDTSSNERKKT